ncbi:SEL1-like repeat protein [Pseudomonas sp. NPDC078416]|uniref:SEL1-like repeat protein n=1 Tax=Pseudomonas sp. NPDC078416 TaxID=3390637 RepID=UPI003D07D33E
MNYYRSAALILALLLTGCDAKDNNITKSVSKKSDYDAVFKNLEFECVHESTKLPALDADAESLYRYGLHLTQAGRLKNLDQAARYYRIAAAFVHYRAATRLQGLLSQGLTSSPRPERETINLVEELMASNIPGAYYDMGHYLESGYGVKQDVEAARYYFRRAADLGNPEGLYYAGESLVRIKEASGIAFLMIRCATEQGHTAASFRYATVRQVQEDFGEAIRGYQTAIRAGDSSAAMVLKKSFLGPKQSNALYKLGLDEDKERSRRYGLIVEFLRRYEHLGAKVPDIDQIVPLPPAKLPEWDETFEWKRKRDAAVPPSAPSEELIARMCEEKDLDPATGWPLSGLK